jgi:galactose-1-phosphate uridylyltransferase
MPVEYRKEGRRLVWIRNPFTRAVTYFTEVHRKQSGFPRRSPSPALAQPDVRAAEAARFAELEAARRDCPFCPGNERMTTEELLRVRPEEVEGAAPTASPWLIRAFTNLYPRIPECCTGGRNESYVVVEDPRHFADGALHQEELLYSALLPAAQLRAVLRTNVEVARRAYDNPAVAAVLIRKNQGRESGASQPHLHNQVIGADQPFSPVLFEEERLREEPRLWNDILDLMDGEGFLIEERDGFFLYFCPFGTFPRSYEIVCPRIWSRITEIAAADLDTFTSLLHRALEILGPLPLDYEIHDGPGIPLHAHVSARSFPYSNIGGTLNLPADVPADFWKLPHTRR